MQQRRAMNAYRAAGVDRNVAKRFIEKLRFRTKILHADKVRHGMGGFAAVLGMEEGAFLVASSDGIGTKILVARMAGAYQGLGVDLVAMVVNDLITTGAKPLFFLDYLAFSSLEENTLDELTKGLAQGLEAARMDLVGGETAQMPGMYQDGLFEFAGFGIGSVPKRALVTTDNPAPGDVLVGLASSGLHSNAFTLVRRVLFEQNHYGIRDRLPELENKPLAEVLLAPTKIYVDAVQRLVSAGIPKGMAHITGGGITENVPRMLANNVQAVVELGSLSVPPLFRWLMEKGQIQEEDAFGTFNMGVGFVVAVSPSRLEEAMALLGQAGETPSVIGRLAERYPQGPHIRYEGKLA